MLKNVTDKKEMALVRFISLKASRQAEKQSNYLNIIEIYFKAALQMPLSRPPSDSLTSG